MKEFHGEVSKMMIILSKATLENVYAAFVLAEWCQNGGDRSWDIFYIFWSWGNTQGEIGTSAY